VTYYEAALYILKAAQRPLTTQEVTQRAIERGLIAPRGKTPERTMAAVLYRQRVSGSEIIKLGDRGAGARAKPGTARWTVPAK
jgi:hypothetical protein